MGIAGGFVMVVFFSFWGRAYGRAHLGRIQGAAQAMTVVASAVGPLFLALCVDATGRTWRRSTRLPSCGRGACGGGRDRPDAGRRRIVARRGWLSRCDRWAPEMSLVTGASSEA